MIEAPDTIFELIHRGPHEARPWQSLLSHIRDRLNCQSTGIVLNQASAGRSAIAVYETDEERVNHDYARQFADNEPYRHLSPLENALTRSREVMTLDEAVNGQTLRGDEYYRRFLQPYGIVHQVGMCVIEPHGWKCFVGGQRRADQPPFGEAEKALLRAMGPHFEIALETFARARLLEAETEMMEGVLDRLTIAAFILDGEGKVKGQNKMAGRLLSEPHGLFVRQGHLHLQRSSADKEFQAILVRARLALDQRGARPVIAGRTIDIRAEAPEHDFVDVLRVENDADANLGILIRSMPASSPYRGVGSPATIVYVSNAGQRKLAEEQFLAKLFGLSPAEAAVSIALANGLSLAEIAAQQGVSEQTVRSSSKRIFVKTGVVRQSELVRLIHTSVALLA